MEIERQYILAKSSRVKGAKRSGILFLNAILNENMDHLHFIHDINKAQVLSLEEMNSVVCPYYTHYFQETIYFPIVVPDATSLEISDIFRSISQSVETITSNCGLINAIDIHDNAIFIYSTDSNGETYVVEEMFDCPIMARYPAKEMKPDTRFRFLDLE